MPKFELKLITNAENKQHLISALGLEFVQEIADRDTYLHTKRNAPKEKIKEIEGRTIFYTISFIEAEKIFQTTDKDITDDYKLINDLKQRKVSAVIDRSKEVYEWEGSGVSIAFDHIRSKGDVVFIEIYGDNKWSILEAKEQLSKIGYNDIYTKVYDELAEKKKPIYKDPLAWVIVAVATGLAVAMLMQK